MGFTDAVLLEKPGMWRVLIDPNRALVVLMSDGEKIVRALPAGSHTLELRATDGGEHAAFPALMMQVPRSDAGAFERMPSSMVRSVVAQALNPRTIN
jgi:hypothetical protein